MPTTRKPILGKLPRPGRAMAPALLAALALGAAMPASAHADPYPSSQRHQGYDDHRTPARAEAIRNQIAELERRIARNDNRDRISEREATALRRDVRQLRDQFRNYNRNGLSNTEMRTLERRIADIRQRLHIERNDRDGRRW